MSGILSSRVLDSGNVTAEHLGLEPVKDDEDSVAG